MARHSVAELWGAAPHPSAAPHAGALARVPTGQLPAVRAEDTLAAFVQRVPVSPVAMVLGGLALAGVGGIFALFVSSGFPGALLFGGMLTFGGGVAVLGMRKAGAPVAPPTPAPQVDPHVLAERARRVHAVLGRGTTTFEGLLAQLRWTERALVETLVSMKDTGAIIEDLDLDSGEWVYRLQYTDSIGAPASMTLADRQHH